MECNVDYDKVAKVLRMLNSGFWFKDQSAILSFTNLDIMLLDNDKDEIYLYHNGEKIFWKKIDSEWERCCIGEVIDRFVDWIEKEHVVSKTILNSMIEEIDLGNLEEIIDGEAQSFSIDKSDGSFLVGDSVFVIYGLDYEVEHFAMLNIPNYAQKVSFNSAKRILFDSYGKRMTSKEDVLDSFKFGIRRNEEAINFLKSHVCDRSERWIREKGM